MEMVTAGLKTNSNASCGVSPIGGYKFRFREQSNYVQYACMHMNDPYHTVSAKLRKLKRKTKTVVSE